MGTQLSAEVSMRIRRLVAAFLLVSCALAQEASPVLRGRWTATVGAQVMRGTWSAQGSPDNPNAVQGSWTLLSDAGEAIGGGTWSAEKTRRGWLGSWTARTLSGRSLSGTWTAEITGISGKSPPKSLPNSLPNSLQDMLEMTAQHQIAGAWRSGGHKGNWWLKSRTPLAGSH